MNLKMKMILLAPVLLKSSAYILMGVGGAVNALGYSEVGGAMLGLAAVFGLKEAVSSGQVQP